MSEMPENGPSDATLRFLRGALPSMVEGLKQGKIGTKGTPAVRKPVNICRVCGINFSGPKLAQDKSFCPRCQALLSEGYVALISIEDYAFVKSPKLADKAGELLPIGPEVMAKVKARFAGANGVSGKIQKHDDPPTDDP